MSNSLGHGLFCAVWTTFSKESRLANLPQTEVGARAFADIFERAGMVADNPVVLVDLDATTVLNAIDSFLALPHREVTILLSSHGLTPTASDPLYRLATSETRTLNDLVRSLPISEVFRAVHSAGKPTTILLDSCYAGRAGNEMLSPAARHHTEAEMTIGGQDISLLASAGPFEAAIAPQGERLTLFMTHLTNILTKSLTDGVNLSLDEIFVGVCDRLGDDPDAPRPFFVSQGKARQRKYFRTLAVEGASYPVTQEFDSALSPSDQESHINQRLNAASILYIDDDAKELRKLSDALSANGHIVRTESLSAEAKKALEERFYDIVVLDLLDKNESLNADLIDHIGQSVRSSTFLLTTRESLGRKETWDQRNWENLQTVFRYPSRVDGLIFKAELIDTVADIADEIRSLRVHILDHVEELDSGMTLATGRMIKRSVIAANDADEIQQQLRVCVQSLFAPWFRNDAKMQDYISRMTILPIDSGRSTCSVFAVTPTVLGLIPSAINPLILKVGPKAEIEKEVLCYDKYVQVGVPLDQRTDRISWRTVGRVAGILYSLRGAVDGKIEELAQLDEAAIHECLDSIFNPGEKRWYGSVKTGMGTVPSTYFRKLGMTTTKMREAAQSLNAGIEKARRSPGPFIEPSVKIDEFLYETPALSSRYTDTLIHGDLNLSNIVRTGPAKYVLLDYATVGIGPRVVDIARVEVELWLRAQAPEASRSQRLVDALLAVASVDTNRDYEDGDIPDWCHEPVRLVKHCRRMARENFADLQPDEYNSILFLTALRRSLIKSTAETKSQVRTMEVMPAAICLAAQDAIRAEL